VIVNHPESLEYQLGAINPMVRIFWATCPDCKGRFQCHYEELRHKKIQLLCPYCGNKFLDAESPRIEE